MKVMFYEMPEKWRYNNIKYYRHAATGNHVGSPPLVFSSRIWSWDPLTDEVKYVKNRQTGIMTPVDRKEFLMIQLQAVEWKNETS